ncbi:MAG: tryptophan-rich sensory protein [Thermoguttaceae bacterium]|nr:tryptophan-rich sensory protein [Thermoguttaceae bacterium]MDW8079740.1 TspO/MBR family protein [Thermoguttaceae bacterium]
MDVDFRTWYDQLIKPPWTPPPWMIGLIWSILYPLIAISFGYVFLQVIRGKIPAWVAIPFLINLVANLLFMPIFSGWKNLWLASVDVVVVWLSIPWAMWTIWPYAQWVALFQVPYLCWVTIATTLMLYILFANP